MAACATAEERLGLDAGFFKNSAKWFTKSKDIIEDEFILSSPGSHLHTANQQPSTSTMASHAPSDIITTLPSEVLGIIVHHCDDEDLGNLRLSCKTLGTATTVPFGRRRLAHRRFIFTEHSLQGLVNLTTHPDFSPCVRSLSFGTRRLEGRTLSPQTDGEEQRLEMLAKKQHDFTQSGAHVVMLVQALQNLTAHKNSQVTLGIHEDVEEGQGVSYQRGYGFDTAYDDFLPELCEGTNTLAAVINATTVASFIPVGLHIAICDSRTLLHELMEDPVVRSFITTPGGNLNPRMDICIDTRKGGDDCRLYVATKASRLEVTHHMLEDWVDKWTLLEESAYGRFYHALKQTAIISVIIKDSDGSMPGFSDSLRGWESSLRHLILSNLQMYDIFDGNHKLASALIFFRYIRDNLSLNILEMEQVSIETETGTEEIPILQETISWSGRHEIREGLDSIIAYWVATSQSDSDEEQWNI
ncbi:hypothetical protein D6C84_02160 [Aureobasidium pullulans]|uniref:F-box domain-containing protein n=1 Tax=Aureobasidium pullulans TaxID=5580 RepID=A0A4S9Y5C8_AURPU|nr:hypothetical protein D6C84_02160 [Aureobasidium pullulans]